MQFLCYFVLFTLTLYTDVRSFDRQVAINLTSQTFLRAMPHVAGKQLHMYGMKKLHHCHLMHRPSSCEQTTIKTRVNVRAKRPDSHTVQALCRPSPRYTDLCNRRAASCRNHQSRF